MSRLTPYLGIVAGLLFGSLIIAFSSRTVVVPPPVTSFIRGISASLSVVDTIFPITPSVDTPPKTAPAPEKSPLPSKVPPTIVPVSAKIVTPVPVTTLPPASGRSVVLITAGSALISALVNIICYAPAGSGLHSISASGVFIDPKGIILTNAHVAQYFLIADKDVSCTIRSGTPATDRYQAKLVYISPAWIHTNPNVLTQTLPSGTGEHDVALLAVSGSATANSLPTSFPFVPLATIPASIGTPIVIASYGAQFLDPSQIISTLFPTMVFGSVKDVFTFDTNTIDVLSLGGSAIAQEGSSGGGVANANGELVGTVTTSTVSGAVNTRSLSAITASYIRAEYASETGQPLDILLTKPASFSIASFASQIPDLEAVITAQLP